jgi:ankyrin repeat protein
MDTTMYTLLDAPMDVPMDVTMDVYPLHIAAIEGNLAAVRLVLGQHPDLMDEIDSTGATALKWAVTLGHEDIVKELLNAKANDYNPGETLLHCAASAGLGGIVKLLIETQSLGTYQSEEDQNGQYLLIAVINRDSSSIRQILENEIVYLDARDNDLLTSLLWAVKYRDVGLAEQLLARGADVNADNEWSGSTALHQAAGLGYYDIVKLLLDKGAEVNKTDSRGRTALHDAVAQEDARVVRLLLAYGADIDAVSNAGQTALHCACESARLYTIHFLIKCGVSTQNFGFEQVHFDPDMPEDEQERVKALLEVYLGH